MRFCVSALVFQYIEPPTSSLQSINFLHQFFYIANVSCALSRLGLQEETVTRTPVLAAAKQRTNTMAPIATASLSIAARWSLLSCIDPASGKCSWTRVSRIAIWRMNQTITDKNTKLAHAGQPWWTYTHEPSNQDKKSKTHTICPCGKNLSEVRVLVWSNK